MKKILTVALILGVSYTAANATEIRPYAGLDFGYNRMRTEDVALMKRNTNKLNYGLNAGAAFNFDNNLFAGAELYYRFGKLAEKSASDNIFGVEIREKFEAKNTFGTKLYFGYQFNDELNAFVSFGLNRMEAEAKFFVDGIAEKETKNKFAPSYGLGVNYEFVKNVSARLSYEFIDYKVADGVELDTHSIRLGINYLF